MDNPLVLAWLTDVFTWLALALLGGCFIYGLLLLALPGTAMRAASYLNRRVSSRRALRPLEIPRFTERLFYRRHRIFGGLILLGVIGFFAMYFGGFPRASLLATLKRQAGHDAAIVLLDSATAFFLLANALIGIFALIVIFRPSLLKPVEQWANRWISTRRAFRGADASRQPLDDLVAAHPRLAGALVLAGVGYVVASVALLL